MADTSTIGALAPPDAFATAPWKDARTVPSPLPRRPKGPSAIAAASASPTAPDSGSEDDSAPGAQPDATAVPMSAAAAAFAAESTPGRRTTGTGTGTPTGRADAHAAGTGTGPGTGTALRPAPRRRLPKAVLLVGASVAVAALVGGAFLIGNGGDHGTRPSSSMPGTVPGTAGDGGSYDGTPSLLGPPPPSVSASASPSTARSASPAADATGASPRSSAGGSAKDGGTPAHATPSTASADGTGKARAVSGGGAGGSSCVSAQGSGAITDYSVCLSSGTVTLRVTFHTRQSFYHAFFNTDGDTGTGYQLPYPSPSALGADYMIENGSLYRSRSADWSWTEIAPRPKHTVSGSTHTWTLPLSGIGSPTGTQRLEFNAGSDYTSLIAFSPK
ncbi:hypothetical protein [Streptomyces sp. NPDC048277]|uniref:hypothetical protein n=1 Tax=Streptomyces sp. NPDC048277 TaxID=3155027 RepID=UPI0033BFD83E